MSDPSLLGHIIEGVVERDPLTGQLHVTTVQPPGKAVVTDVQKLLEPYLGKEVRLTLASFENLSRLAEMVEQAGSGLVHGVMAQDLPASSYTVLKKG